ncbi:hypothetical protein EAE92_12670 [Photorhabdus hainanensis]|nr:hypothetical protein [Photorhabdus hainanensis]
MIKEPKFYFVTDHSDIHYIKSSVNRIYGIVLLRINLMNSKTGLVDKNGNKKKLIKPFRSFINFRYF